MRKAHLPSAAQGVVDARRFGRGAPAGPGALTLLRGIHVQGHAGPERRGPLGLTLDVDLNEGSALLVEEVKEGLVEQWNSSNEEAQVRSGDFLVEMNGIDGNSRRMLADLSENKLLEIVVLRSHAIRATSQSSSASS